MKRRRFAQISCLRYSEGIHFQSDKDAANFAKLLGYIKDDANNKVGYFSKDTFDSEFCNDWQKAFADVEKVCYFLNISQGSRSQTVDFSGGCLEFVHPYFRRERRRRVRDLS